MGSDAVDADAADMAAAVAVVAARGISDPRITAVAGRQSCSEIENVYRAAHLLSWAHRTHSEVV